MSLLASFLPMGVCVWFVYFLLNVKIYLCMYFCLQLIIATNSNTEDGKSPTIISRDNIKLLFDIQNKVLIWFFFSLLQKECDYFMAILYEGNILYPVYMPIYFFHHYSALQILMIYTIYLNYCAFYINVLHFE